jgi:DNA-binding transcriptional MerR regulator
MSVEAGLTIAYAARASGVSAYTLRYYERAGLVDGLGRADSGHRRYSNEDRPRVDRQNSIYEETQ